MDATMAAATLAPVIPQCMALRMVLPTGEVLLSTGFPVSFPVGGVVKTFTPLDPVYGTLSEIAAITSQVTSSAPAVEVTMMIASPDGLANINAPNAQGSLAQLFWCIVDKNTGTVVGAPELLYNGQLDFCVTTDNVNTRTVEVTLTTMFERLFASSEGERLNDTWHQSLYPGETGLSLVVESASQVFWGEDATVPAYTPTPIAPTIGDRISGITLGGLTDGSAPG